VDPKGTGKPYQYLAAIRYAKQKQWSHELQLIGHTSKVDWVGGLFYFREKAYLNSPTIYGQVSTPGVEIPITNPGSYGLGDLLRVLNRSFAAYAHANVHLGDRVELGGGIRYSKDKRMEDDLQLAPRTPPRGKYTASQGRVDYDATLKYTFAENSNVYAKFATGFVSGGIFKGVEFKPETVKSYEIGLKSEFLDRRMRVNIAVFQADRKNLQVSGYLPEVGGNVLVNSGSARNRGFELETTFVPVDGLTLTGNYGFTDTKMSSGVRSYQPRHSGYLAADYAMAEFGNGIKPSFRIDAQYIGKHYRLLCPYGSTTSEAAGCTNLASANYTIDKALIIPATWQIGARFALADIPVGPVKAKVSLWGKNLNNSKKFEYLFQAGGVIGTFQVPRTYGVDVGIEF